MIDGLNTSLPRPASGNGALEALQRWFDEAADFDHSQGTGPDQLLMWLWVEGFKVVPLDAADYARISADQRKIA